MASKKRYSTEGELITQDNWTTFVEDYTLTPGFIGYIRGTNDIVDVLNKMLENSKDFESLQNQLKNFANERANFATWAEDHYP